MRMPHIGCYRGKRVRIVLWDGGAVEGRFHDRSKSHVFLQGGRRIPKREIRAFIIVKGE